MTIDERDDAPLRRRQPRFFEDGAARSAHGRNEGRVVGDVRFESDVSADGVGVGEDARAVTRERQKEGEREGGRNQSQTHLVDAPSKPVVFICWTTAKRTRSAVKKPGF